MHKLRWALVLVSLAAAGCRSADTGSVRVDPALAALVPDDAVFLAGVRMEAVRATPLYRKWVADKPRPLVDEFAKETGLDLRKDLWELLLASDGKDTLAMARGKFAPQGLEPRLQRGGARRMPYKGYTLIGDENAVVAFMNTTTAVAGPAKAIRSLIDQRNRSDRGTAKALLAKVNTIPAQNQIWAVSVGPSALADKVPQSGNLANLGKILAMLETSTVAVDLRSGLNLVATGVCRTEQDARTLGDALRGLVGLARLSTPDNEPELLRAYDGIRIQQQQRSVRVEAQVPQDLLDKLLARAESGPKTPWPGQARPGGK